MKRLFEPDPKIKKFADVCDAIKASREKAGRETWNAGERRAFVAAAQMLGTTFASFNAPAGTAPLVQPHHDDADTRIRDREREEQARRQQVKPPSQKPGLVYADDDDEPWEIR